MNGPTSARPAARILLVEDEPALVLTLTDGLEAEGYQVEAAADGPAGLERLRRGAFDLVILDVGLPKKNGYDVCRDLRNEGFQTPVLMLTARGQLVDRVLGLKLGADDYLVKPFETLELLARVEALLRRAQAGMRVESGSFAFGDVKVDLERGEVRRMGAPVPLSSLEFKLLCYFVERRGSVLTRDELLDQVWGYDATPVSRTVDVHVSTLRQKLEPDPARPRYIVTVHGRGYRFDP